MLAVDSLCWHIQEIKMLTELLLCQLDCMLAGFLFLPVSCLIEPATSDTTVVGLIKLQSNTV